MSWTRFRYHEGHAMPTASRDTNSWLYGANKIDKAPTAQTNFIVQKSTLSTAQPASIPKANVGSRSKLLSGAPEETPGPGAYNVVKSSFRPATSSGVSIKGGPKRAPVRDTTTHWPQKLKDDAGNGAGFYEKLTTFGDKRNRTGGGVIGKANRTIAWMNKREHASTTAQFYTPQSTLKVNSTAFLGSRSPRFVGAANEATPGPAAYSPRVPQDPLLKKGVRIARTGRKLPQSGPAFSTSEETPGPGAYAPESVYDMQRSIAFSLRDDIDFVRGPPAVVHDNVKLKKRTASIFMVCHMMTKNVILIGDCNEEKT
ncbi:unnamed protein product [Amoebophrya sp. A120]|nr:unnamed protein product [Amoebophrya sp. A120]|eukprot:GSA120T00001912001.1